MTYFRNDPQPEEEYQPVFRQEDDYPDAYYDEENPPPYTGEYLDPDYLDELEEQELRQNQWRMLAAVGDFFSVLAGTAVILVLIALLISLITWVQGDISQTFTLWQTKL